MSDRISEKDLMMRLVNHNAWTEDKILDFDSLGAGGSRTHLIIFNTQKYLGYLMTKSQLWDLLGSVSNFDETQKDKPTKVFMDEYERLSKGGKLNHSFMYDLRPSGSGYGKQIMGKNFEKNIKASIKDLKSNGENINRSYTELEDTN